jgi:hypothetical protein
VQVPFVPAVAPPPRRRTTGAVDLGRTLLLAVVAASVLNVVWGFLPGYSSAAVGATVPVFTTAGAYAPVLLLIAGLVAAGTFLPGCRRNDYLTAVLSTVGAGGALATFLLGEPPLAIGAVLLLIFGVLQAVVAIGVLVLGYRGRRFAAGDPATEVSSSAATAPGPAVPPPVVAPGAVPAGAVPAPAGPVGYRPAAAPAPGPSYDAAVGGVPGIAPQDPDGRHDDGDDPEATRFVRF